MEPAMQNVSDFTLCDLKKRWAKCGPRTKSDPPRPFVRPVEDIFSQN